jgi:hypothetical protein
MKLASPRKLAAARFQLLLRIKHPTLDTADLTRRLQIEPEHAANAGASMSGGKRSLHSESYWLAVLSNPPFEELVAWTQQSPSSHPPQAEVESKLVPFTQQPQQLAKLSKEVVGGMLQAASFHDFYISMWLRKLEAHRDLLQGIVAEQGTVTLVVQRPNRNQSFTVTPRTARRLADLQIALEVD